MKNNKMLAPLMIGGVLVLTTGCEMGSTYHPKYSYDIEVDTYLEWLEESTDYYGLVYDALGVDLPSVRPSKFEEIKSGVYSYKRSGGEIKIYTKNDDISRIELQMDQKKMDDEDILSMTALFEVVCMVLNPELYFDSEGNDEFKEFFQEVREETDNMTSDEDFYDSFTLHDSDYEVDYKDERYVTFSITANGDVDFEHEGLERALEILKDEGYYYFIRMIYNR